MFAGIFLLTTGFYSTGYAQGIDYRDYNFKSIDAHADSASRMNFSTIKALGEYLVKPAKNDLEKARAIYRWISSHIEYDARSYFSNSYTPTDSENVFVSRRSVCDGYANLYESLAKVAGLEAVKISGYAKGYGYNAGGVLDSRPNHAWNAVKLNQKWYLVDSTWGAGYLENQSFMRRFENHYFLTPPGQFIYDHLPEESRWQLLDKPVSRDEYAALPYLRPDFFKNGLQLISHPSGQISSTEQLLFTLGVNQRNIPENASADFAIMAMLYSRQKELDRRQVLVQKKNNKVEILARFPGKGEYILRIFTREPGASGRYFWAGDFQVEASAGTTEKFPLAYETPGKEIYLLAPLQGELKPGQSYNFTLEAPGAETVAVVAGKTWVFLKNENGRFTGAAKAEKGDNHVYVKYANEQNFRGAFTFTGN